MRHLVRFVCVLLIAVGAGLLVYGVTVEPANYRMPADIRLLGSPTECVAWGTGILVGGLLFLALFGFRPASADPDPV